MHLNLIKVLKVKEFVRHIVLFGALRETLISHLEF